jgi:RNA polymerase sigma-70 factor, ECF subfamily
VIRFGKTQSNGGAGVILANLDSLYGFAMSLTHNRTDAEDLVQEACLRAIKGLTQSAAQRNPKVWLFTILRNVWINEWRRRTRGPKFILLETARADSARLQDWAADESLCVEDSLDRHDVSGKLRQAISSLPEPFREVVVLRYFEGFSYREIAAIVGCPAGTVMSRLNRARAELRAILDERNTALMILRRRRGSG